MTIRLNRRKILYALLAASAVVLLPAAALETTPDPHAHHHHAMTPQASSERSYVDYAVPRVKLVREDGKAVWLADELNDGRPVFLNFIYTTCTTICPVSSQIFSQLQDALGADRGNVHIVSISIDPEHDTPARLMEYARKFHAGPTWQHYTGSVEASIAAQKGFQVYRGDKMNHNPVTLVRAAPGKPWLRVEGFSSAQELLSDYRNLLAAN